MFIAASFTIVKVWKQPNCQTTNEWRKMWYIYAMEYYSIIKREWNFAICRNMDLEGIMLSKILDRERQILWDTTM